MKKGELPAKRVNELADLIRTYDYELHKNDLIYHTALTALGSPKIAASVKVNAHVVAESSGPKTKSVIRGALACSTFGDGKTSLPDKSTEGYRVFLRNATAFGDLENPRLVKLFRSLLACDNDPDDVELADFVRDGLLERDSLPDTLLDGIYNSPSRGSDDLYLLFKRSDYLRNSTLPRNNVVRIDNGDGTEYCILPPQSDPQFIRSQYEMECESNKNAQWSLLNTPNCPKDVYKHALATGHPLMAVPNFLALSPFAGEYVSRFKGDGFWARFRAVVLDDKIAEGEALTTLCMPNIPFRMITPQQIKDAMPPDDGRLCAAYIIGAIRSREFAEALGPVSADPVPAIAKLFSPHTSGVQLDKMAKLHPDLAPVISFHPNAVDVATKKSSARKSKSASIPLAGRSGGTSVEPDSGGIVL